MVLLCTWRPLWSFRCPIARSWLNGMLGWSWPCSDNHVKLCGDPGMIIIGIKLFCDPFATPSITIYALKLFWLSNNLCSKTKNVWNLPWLGSIFIQLSFLGTVPHYAHAFVTDSSTLKSWRKQCPVFEHKANPVFVTTEKLFIFSQPHFKLKNARKSDSNLTQS